MVLEHFEKNGNDNKVRYALPSQGLRDIRGTKTLAIAYRTASVQHRQEAAGEFEQMIEREDGKENGCGRNGYDVFYAAHLEHQVGNAHPYALGRPPGTGSVND